MKISQVIAALQYIQKQHGDLACAEDLPLGYLAIRDVEVRQIPPGRALRSVPHPVVDGELVVLIKAQ